jgi:hypothetical protein
MAVVQRIGAAYALDNQEELAAKRVAKAVRGVHEYVSLTSE